VPVDVGKLIVGMAELLASTTGPQINLVVDHAPHLPAALADPNQLEMAILNLAVNARDAMPDGGTLRIAAVPYVVGRDHSSGLKPGPYLLISVVDTGVGMEEATLARAVEPFFSTKGVGRGTGLGLSMVHGLAKQLGGALSIHSKPGLGTTIELLLPQGDSIAQASKVNGELDLKRLVRGTVILVDDEEHVRSSTADMLLDLGYAVHESESAERALELIEQGVGPDLVITDHLMPGMTGTELFYRLRDQLPAVKTLIVSGYADTEGLPSEIPTLSKPFRQAELAERLAALN
jgi:CheY-like chemotaxis protein